jgi:hypothetical protein
MNIKPRHIIFGFVVFAIIYLLTHKAFAAQYRVQGYFEVQTKAESDTLKVDLAALAPITNPDKLDVLGEKSDRKNVETLSVDIVFKDPQEAQDYYNELVKQNKNARVDIHLCTQIEYGDAENKPCVLLQQNILKKQ